MILAVVGTKGGQGKTTLAVRLSAWLAVAGHRTLVVDLAATRSASQLLGFADHAGPGSGEVLAGAALGKSVRDTPHPKLHALPADAALEAASTRALESQALRLSALAKGYDFVVLDAPPSFGGTARMALLAADWALVPVVPDELGAGGALATLDWMADTRRRFSSTAKLAGLVVNQSEERVLGTRTIETRLRKAQPRDVLKTAVRRDHSVRTATTLARIWEKPQGARGADLDIVALRSELLKVLVRRG